MSDAIDRDEAIRAVDRTIVEVLTADGWVGRADVARLLAALRSLPAVDALADARARYARVEAERDETTARYFELIDAMGMRAIFGPYTAPVDQQQHLALSYVETAKQANEWLFRSCRDVTAERDALHAEVERLRGAVADLGRCPSCAGRGYAETGLGGLSRRPCRVCDGTGMMSDARRALEVSRG